VVDKITLLVQELVKGKVNSELVGDNTLLTSYFTPRKDPRKFNHVKLRPLTLIGFMEMGKTETAKYLINLSKEHFDKMGIGNIALAGKTMIDIVHYLYNNKDILRDTHVVHLFVDDLFYGGLSSEQSKTKRLNEKYYSDIRHKLEELGMTRGILYVLFSGQRFSLIPVFFRNSPFLLFKGLSIQDRYERDILLDTLSYSSDENDVYAKKYASLLLDILEAVSEIAYTQYNDDVKALTVVKPIRRKPYVFIVPRLVNIDLINVPFNYSGVFDVDSPSTEEINGKEIKRALHYLERRFNELREQGYIISRDGYIYLKFNDIKIRFLHLKALETLGIHISKLRKHILKH